MERVVEHRNRLHGAVAESPPREVFKGREGVTKGHGPAMGLVGQADGWAW